MTLLPRTLLWRTVLLLAVLLVASQSAWMMLNEIVEREMRARQISHHAIGVANVLRSALAASRPDRRRAMLAELANRDGVRIFPATDRSPDPVQPEPPVMELVRSQIRDGLGGDTQVELNRSRPPALWVGVDIGGEPYWLAIWPVRVDRPFPWRWAAWASVVLLLSLAGAYLLVRRINRPLRGLTAAASALGRGEAPPQLPENGPTEVRTVIHAFNQMTDDLKRLEAERALTLAGVPHDLRTPLARLHRAVDALPDDAAKQAMLEDIVNMDAIVDQFLTFAREGASEPLDYVDLNALVSAVCQRFVRAGGAVVVQQQPLPILRLRPTAMQRLLSNLIDNALKHAAPAHGAEPIEVHTGHAGRYAFVSVLDRGPGMPADEVARWLNPFARGDALRTGIGAAGLGLAIVDRIARSHDGRVQLLRRAGGGLEVRVDLPLTGDQHVGEVQLPLPDASPDESVTPRDKPMPSKAVT